ncbi:hypothetical protein NAT51_15290 [Flavobacterium amniphilum]|uniref:hypothetical protein n=1 Tax=Flavobacterium amniphilum TaxID=1834035 RepID=UPI002029C86A|nr:hypothetical protein [Flavobacterium amniphilum]MCL9806899.1 hypothetical protein [Flavobacterium amniphilum]
MKKNFLIILIVFSNLRCSSQNNFDAWLPEEYVKAIKTKDTSSYKHLIPIEGFESFGKNPRILTYRGEINPIKTKKIIDGNKEKYQLLNLQYYVNLKYNSRELAERLSKATIYISKSGQKLLLEIIEKDKKENIYFINRVDEYEFKNIKDAKEYLEKD